jgi:hypothetical protein
MSKVCLQRASIHTTQILGRPKTLRELEEFAKDIIVDRCSTGVIEDGVKKPARKYTRLRTRSDRLVDMHKDAKLQCRDSHGTLRGEPLRQAQNYEPKFAAKMAEAVIQDNHGRQN